MFLLVSILTLQIATAALFVMLACDAETIRETIANAFSYKRVGAIRFVRIGRVSGSFCVRKG